MSGPLPTAEFDKWVRSPEFRRRVDRISRRLAARLGIKDDPNNYWDLHQEIAARALEMFRRGERPLDAARTAWLRKLAFHTAAQFAEAHKKHVALRSIHDVVGDHGAPLEAVVSDDRERFTRAYLRRRGEEFFAHEIDRLPPMYQQPVLLVDIEGKPMREAAKAAGVPYRTMVSRHAAAHKLLAKRLSEYLDDMTREPV